MEKLVKQVEVTKEFSELWDGLAEIVRAAKVALADGFQPGQDLPVIAAQAFGSLTKAIGGLDQLDEEAKGATGAFVRGGLLGAADVLEAALAKKE